jgi:hypothetical protein
MQQYLKCTHSNISLFIGISLLFLSIFALPIMKNDWGTLVPRINVENVMKLGFVLE